MSLIISLWSPDSPNPGFQNNSYWLDMAFKHADSANLWALQATGDTPPNRYRLLCWCCIVRDRHLALVMRRPYRLHKVPVECTIVTEFDFGIEAYNPSFSSLPSKQMAMFAFIWLCKLSEIMATIAVFQQQAKFSRDWTGCVGSSCDLDKAYAFDQNLEVWTADFEYAVSDRLRNNTPCFSIPCTLLRMIR